MRTTGELLTLLLEYYTNPNTTALAKKRGLCTALYCLGNYSDVHMKMTEYMALKAYLAAHLPKGADKYNWHKGEKRPRIEWLQQQIENLEE